MDLTSICPNTKLENSTKIMEKRFRLFLMGIAIIRREQNTLKQFRRELRAKKLLKEQHVVSSPVKNTNGSKDAVKHNNGLAYA